MKKGIVLLACFLAACGFQLRGVQSLPFASLYVEGSPALAEEVGRMIRSGTETRLTEKPEEAEMILHVRGGAQEKRITGLSGAGRVREYQLTYRIYFRLAGKGGQETIPEQTIELYRDMAFDDAQLLAKEQEEALLYRDMHSDAILQLMRRLAVVKHSFADAPASR